MIRKRKTEESKRSIDRARAADKVGFWGWLGRIGIVVAIIVGVGGGIWKYFEYHDKEPDFDVQLRSLQLMRYNNVSAPEIGLRFHVENKASASRSISLDSIVFPNFKVPIRYTFESNEAYKSFIPNSKDSFIVRESALLFDTLISLPFDSNSSSFNIFLHSGATQIINHYDANSISKCIYLQTPKIFATGSRKITI